MEVTGISSLLLLLNMFHFITSHSGGSPRDDEINAENRRMEDI